MSNETDKVQFEVPQHHPGDQPLAAPVEPWGFRAANLLHMPFSTRNLNLKSSHHFRGE